MSISEAVRALCPALSLGLLLAVLPAAAQQAAPPSSPQAPASAADNQRDFSPAEKLLFMTQQLQQVKPPATLRYAFRRTGTLEPAFDDKVNVVLDKQEDGSCCTAKSEFLTGERRLPLPEVPAAEGNPVIMYFLERDVREMQRLTKGSQTHFRKQIRMAIYNAAAVRDVSLVYRGQPVPAQEVVFSPYLNDPNRPKFEKLAQKEYRFFLSPSVPGGVLAIRTQVAGGDASGQAPLLVEELWLDGAEPPARKATP